MDTKADERPMWTLRRGDFCLFVNQASAVPLGARAGGSGCPDAGVLLKAHRRGRRGDGTHPCTVFFMPTKTLAWRGTATVRLLCSSDPCMIESLLLRCSFT